MGKNLKEQVISTLKEYQKLKKKAALLRYELDNPPSISEKELIESLAISSSGGDGVPRSGRSSDRTMAIAAKYQDTAARMNEDVIQEITSELYTIEAKIRRIDTYVDMLEPERAVVIRRYYLESKTWNEIEDELHLCLRALTNRRDEALKDPMEMYDFVGRVTGEFPL